MKTVLVTGATGFLGNYTIKELKKFPVEYDIIATGRDIEKLKALGVKYRRACLEYADNCNGLFQEEVIDTVVHIAALSSVWGKKKDFFEANTKATANLLLSAIRNKVKRFIFVSSPSIYTCMDNRLNIKEDDFDEDNKLNYYIESKIQAERFLQLFKDEIEIVIIRPRGLIGVGDNSIIPRLLSLKRVPLLNKGQNLVDVTCVENVAYALRLCIDNENAKGHIFNITNGEPKQFKDIVSSLSNKIKFINVPFRLLWYLATILEWYYKTFEIIGEPVLTKYTVCTLGFSQTLDISLSKEVLGYEPIKSLDACIKEYKEWYYENKGREC